MSSPITLETEPLTETRPERIEAVSPPASASATPPAKPERLTSLDAYRGFVMLLMISDGLRMAEVAKHFPGSGLWNFLGYETDHAPWRGCTLWDLIQPSFMFMVGVALPFSLASRRGQGKGSGKLFSNLFWPLAALFVGWDIVAAVSHQFFSNPFYSLPIWVALLIGLDRLEGVSSFVSHALWRSAALIILAIFLTSSWSSSTDYVFTNVLAQIGLGYSFLWLLARTKPRTQLIAAGAILLVSWLMFALYPLPPEGFNYNSVGVHPGGNVPLFTGFEAHWQKNANIAASFDAWFLNLFPVREPFVYNKGGYQTLNFIPALATMIFGLYAGGLLKSDASKQEKFKRMLIYGVAGVVIGLLWNASGLCPLVKRIWTPSFAIFSAGCAFLLLAFFYGIIEIKGWRRWAFPLIVAGMNSIALYCMAQLSQPWVRERLGIHLGKNWYQVFGEYGIMVQMAAVLVAIWLVSFWMYRSKVFIRL
ncbi:MAG TPA: hypothetical protein VGH90_07950 [Chthoniobacteraceae bacterium]|jgi:predicted acyltransferase